MFKVNNKDTWRALVNVNIFNVNFKQNQQVKNFSLYSKLYMKQLNMFKVNKKKPEGRYLTSCVFIVGFEYNQHVNNEFFISFCTCSKLTTKTPEKIVQCCCGVFIVNFKRIHHINLVSLFLTFSILFSAG